MTASALPRRPNYFDGQELGVADFLAQRQHLDGLRHLYNSGLHTWGIAEGLDVVAGSDSRSVIIAPGLAIQPSGQEIIVEAPIALATPGLGGQAVNLFILARPTRTDPSQASLASGYKRLAFIPTPIFAVAGQTVDDEAVFLATAVLAANGEVSQIDLIARRICGYNVGRLEFQGPATSAVGARIELQTNGGEPALSMVAPAVTFDGAMEVAGSLTLGDQQPRAILDVRSKRPTLMQLSNTGGAVLTVDQAGATSLGSAPPTTTARLSVAGGIALEEGQALRIAGAGALQSGATQAAAGLHAVSLGGGAGGNQVGAGHMMFSEAGRIDLYSGAAAVSGVQTLTITAQGQVGIGVAAPAQALAVAGSVQSMKGGFDFGDGVLQNTAAIATTVPVGGIVEWWSGGVLSLPEEFVICDGRTIDDPLSKLNGMATPNLVGSYIVGTDDYGMIGQTGGSATHVHEIQAVPVHTHSIVHMHPGVWRQTSSDVTPGDSDTTDSKCSNVDHVHAVNIYLQDCPEPNSLPNDAALAGQNTQPASSQPSSAGLVMLVRVR